ncbi:hydrogen gas-evolving membrane-bound hydrogenase subunit E [Natranaerofaba carboxydovora]|uniref:hydrogen gas-evolving membrane-bound hydrogenase subunit E n=1 Tax=Natranaerofaba carboxydovora TaxID=2742683 RepID=UPI001F1399D3|nr:hydrogen gas-evolving membrane-bound hydrogenase subunit E [Natranaerofaba carboxydovora]UMZ74589.1 Na(+)/H(+) antiporter subunit A [Natranaerofaba carboxydovora]
MTRRKLFIIALILVLGTNLFIFTMAIAELPTYGDPGNPTNNHVRQHYVERTVEGVGGDNMVANILVDYRAYDTLIEIIVLYSAIIAILATLKFTTN